MRFARIRGKNKEIILFTIHLDNKKLPYNFYYTGALIIYHYQLLRINLYHQMIFSDLVTFFYCQLGNYS